MLLYLNRIDNMKNDIDITFIPKTVGEESFDMYVLVDKSTCDDAKPIYELLKKYFDNVSYSGESYKRMKKVKFWLIHVYIKISDNWMDDDLKRLWKETGFISETVYDEVRRKFFEKLVIFDKELNG